MYENVAHTMSQPSTKKRQFNLNYFIKYLQKRSTIVNNECYLIMCVWTCFVSKFVFVDQNIEFNGFNSVINHDTILNVCFMG